MEKGIEFAAICCFGVDVFNPFGGSLCEPGQTERSNPKRCAVALAGHKTELRQQATVVNEVFDSNTSATFGGFMQNIEKMVVILLFFCMLLITYLGFETASLFQSSSSKTYITLLGVQDSNGVITKLFVESKPGEGRIFVRLNDVPLQDADTQASIANAYDAVAASGYSSVLKSVDILCSYFGDAKYISGQSSGAPLAVAIMAAVEGATLQPDILLTGNIDDDGNIKQVGGIVEKARAAKAYGATVLLLPRGERIQYQPKEICQNKTVGGSTISNCVISNSEVDVATVFNITVVEVGNIREAFEIMKD